MNTSPLKAMFWKECRENLKWGVLALLALSLGLAYAVFRLLYQMPAGQPAFLGLDDFWNSVNLVLTISTPLIGLALGLLQILPEQRRDQWAFLLHRPASRTALFGGKVLPGLCLYLLATVPPLLGVAVWSADPRHILAPFDARFTLAGWAAILSGLPFYFAGLLMALRPARWYGSRFLPVVAAGLGPFAAFWYDEFWQAALACLFVAAVLTCAAWGSFLTSGVYESQPRLGRLSLGLTLGAGLAVAVVSLAVLVSSTYEQFFPSRQAFVTAYAVDQQDRVVRVTYYRNGQMQILDQNGKPLPLNFPRSAMDSNYAFLSFQPVAAPDDLGSRRSTHYGSPERYVMPMQTFLFHAGDSAWFYQYDTQQAIGYATRTGRIAGFLVPRGFAETSEAAGRFSEPLVSFTHHDNSTGLLFFSRSVYQINTEAQSVQKLLAASGTGPLQGNAYLASEFPGRRFGDAFMLRSGNRLIALSGDGRSLFTLPYDPAGPEPYVSAAILPQGGFVFWYSADGYGAAEYGPSKVVTLSATGQMLKTASLPAFLPYPIYHAPGAMGLLVPPALVVFAAADMQYHQRFGNAEQRKSSDMPNDPGLRVLLLLSVVAGLASAFLATLISRRCGDERQGQRAWALGVFWLGGYGVLLLLALRGWPVRLSCPHCGRLRAINRVSCEHCGAAWPLPAPDGTEIRDAGVPALTQR